MAFSAVIALRALFATLGCLMLLTLIYTISIDGLPFRRELLTPWMVATLVDFYVNIVAIAVWVAYKEATWVGAVLWIILLVCFGSITTCTYIVVQLFKLSSENIKQDPLHHVLLRSPSRTTMERRKFSSVLVARIIFSALGCLMFATLVYTLLTDGSPFRKELLTPWMTATLVDFYVNVVAIAPITCSASLTGYPMPLLKDHLKGHTHSSSRSMNMVPEHGKASESKFSGYGLGCLQGSNLDWCIRLDSSTDRLWQHYYICLHCDTTIPAFVPRSIAPCFIGLFQQARVSALLDTTDGQLRCCSCLPCCQVDGMPCTTCGLCRAHTYII